MTTIAETARAFFDACETGKGWEACQAFCMPDASFSSQAEPLAEIETLSGYTDWMKGLMAIMPDGSYDLRCFATDEARGNVCAYAVFSGTHTGEGGPVAATGRRVASDYVYVMDFEDGKIRHMTKIWNAGWAIRELGWG